MKLPSYIQFIEQYIQFPDFKTAQSPSFSEYHETPFHNVVRFRTRQENIIANYLLARENPEDKETIRRLNTLVNFDNEEMSEEEITNLFPLPLYMGEKTLHYYLCYKRGIMPEEVRRKISQAEKEKYVPSEVGRKISETKRRRREERLANSLSKGSKIDSDELSIKNEESTHFNI